VVTVILSIFLISSCNVFDESPSWSSAPVPKIAVYHHSPRRAACPGHSDRLASIRRSQQPHVSRFYDQSLILISFQRVSKEDSLNMLKHIRLTPKRTDTFKDSPRTPTFLSQCPSNLSFSNLWFSDFPPSSPEWLCYLAFLTEQRCLTSDSQEGT
jgi:hypothetical protein